MVICVGNSISGGTGKTPFVIALTKILKEHTNKIAIVSTGYKGRMVNNKFAIKVHPTQHISQDVGDEPLMLSEYADVYVAKKRAISISQAEKDGAKIVILDDGFQDNSIYKDISILVVGSAESKNKLMIPAGPMRESIKTSITKADFITSSSTNLQNINPEKRLLSKEEISVKSDNIDKYILVCGIANPIRVLKSLKKIDIIPVKHYFFPDHHQFSDKEIQFLKKAAKKHSAKILTTTKDFIRLTGDAKNDVLTIDHELKIATTPIFLKKIHQHMENIKN